MTCNKEKKKDDDEQYFFNYASLSKVLLEFGAVGLGLSNWSTENYCLLVYIKFMNFLFTRVENFDTFYQSCPPTSGDFDISFIKVKILHLFLNANKCIIWYPVVSIQSRFDTSRFDTNRSRFDTQVKSFRYTCKVDSIQTEVNSIQPLFT